MKEVSVMCRDCGDLVGGVEAGNYVRWVECGCKYNAPKPLTLREKIGQSLLKGARRIAPRLFR